MALSATFTANFSSFYNAVDKAQASLKDFGEGADKVGKRLDTLANQFSGRKIVQEATLMVKAVEEIGGVSKLTDQELARLGKTAGEAVAKLKALGEDVPKNLQAIADHTKTANKTSSDWLGTLGKMASAVGIGFSVGAITNFVGSVFEAAGAIKDQAAAVGMGAEAFQRIKFAVEQGGGSMEDFTKAANKLNDGLATGSDSTLSALQAAGLSFQTIRNMKPDEAFLAVSAAVGKIEDPMERARIAQDLFGKGAIALLPGMIEGYDQVAKGAKVMSDDTINRLEAAGDAWEKLGNTVTIVTGEVIGRAMAQFEKDLAFQKNLWGSVGAFLKDGVKGYQAFGAAVEQTRLATEAAAAADATAAAQKAALSKTTQGSTVRTKEEAEADKKAAKAKADHAKEMTEVINRIHLAQLAWNALAEKEELEATTLSKVKVGTTLLSAELKKHSDQLKTVVLPAEVAFSDKLEHLVYLAQHGVGVDAVAGLKKLGTAVTELTPPPIHPWQQFKDDARQTLEGLAFDVGQTTIKLIGHWSHWRDVTKDIWGQVQSAISRILGDILYEFEKEFIGGMIKAITGAKLGETLGNELAGGASGGGHYAAAGKAAGSAWVSAFATASIYGLIAYGLYEAFFNEGPGDPHVSPGPTTGYVDYGTGSGAEGGNNPNLGGGQGSDSGSTDASVSMPNLPGYARGTGGRYLDFGAGTPVMLHGREAVVPLDAAQSAAPTTIVVQTILDGRQIAEAIFPYTPQVAMRHRVATR